LSLVSDADTMKLDELAAKAGTSARTVRYYVQRGLLPAPAFRGKDTAYTREHLVRLRAIRRLQDRFLPLDAIQAELANATLDEVERIADERREPDAPVALASPPASGHHPYRHAPAVPGTPPTRWTRWELVPGLELEMAEGVSDEVRELAEEIRERIVGRRGARK
jgi:DNA-binding transcriptional MerR regulator